MLKRLLISWLLLISTALAVTYSQPFAVSHGFTATQSGACDSSYADADDTTNGNPVNSIKTTCVGRNDAPTSTWKKSLTWEAMGVTSGNNATQVDGKFDHSIITRSHTSIPAVGPLEIWNSGDTATCMAADPEAQLVYGSGTGGTAWATQDLTGAVNVNAGCQASTTTLTVRVAIRSNAGNNAAATTQVNIDNLVLVITEVTPSGRSRVIISRLKLGTELGGVD